MAGLKWQTRHGPLLRAVECNRRVLGHWAQRERDRVFVFGKSTRFRHNKFLEYATAIDNPRTSQFLGLATGRLLKFYALASQMSGPGAETWARKIGDTAVLPGICRRTLQRNARRENQRFLWRAGSAGNAHCRYWEGLDGCADGWRRRIRNCQRSLWPSFPRVGWSRK